MVLQGLVACWQDESWTGLNHKAKLFRVLVEWIPSLSWPTCCERKINLHPKKPPKFSMHISAIFTLWGLILSSSSLWYTVSSRVQLNQRGKELFAAAANFIHLCCMVSANCIAVGAVVRCWKGGWTQRAPVLSTIPVYKSFLFWIYFCPPVHLFFFFFFLFHPHPVFCAVQ